ncbi:MAG: hypothetical protein WD100_14160 [Tistlia sp.]
MNMSFKDWSSKQKTPTASPVSAAPKTAAPNTAAPQTAAPKAAAVALPAAPGAVKVDSPKA